MKFLIPIYLYMKQTDRNIIFPQISVLVQKNIYRDVLQTRQFVVISSSIKNRYHIYFENEY